MSIDRIVTWTIVKEGLRIFSKNSNQYTSIEKVMQIINLIKLFSHREKFSKQYEAISSAIGDIVF